jgi:hypothetical protein
MPILYTLNKSKDTFVLTVEQDTNVILNYVCNSKKEVYNDTLFSDNTLVLPVKEDGRYELKLNVEGETEVIENFASIYNLQKSLIADIQSSLLNCNYTCNCGSFSKCVTTEAKNSLNNKDIYVKLLTFQNLYFPIIGENLSIFFSTYLKEVADSIFCELQTGINNILKEECLYGNTINNTNLFNKYLSYYYIGIYALDKNIANNNQEELTYIETKYSIQKLYSCFNNLCITVSNIESIFNNVTSSNTPPIVNDFTINVPNNLINNNFLYSFTGPEFIQGFTDIQGNLPKNLKFFALPVRGDLKFNGNSVVKNVPYSYEEVLNFTYEANINVNESIFDLIIFQISDDNINNELYSEMATITINSAGYINLPISQLGDLILNKGNRQNHVFTINDFTTNLNPPYQDPEGDSLDAIRIDVLATNGVMQLNGVPVTQGQIISAANINAGLLVFVSPNQNAAATSNAEFSARDTGSLIFVS